MSGLATPPTMLRERGIHRDLGEFVAGAAFSREGRFAAFALSDGAVWRVPLDDREAWSEIAAHDGAALSIAPDAAPDGFVTGGDDGRFRRIDVAGKVSDIAPLGTKWVEQVATFATEAAGRKAAGGLLACSVGKSVHVFDAGGERLKTLEHPSTVTGLVFDAKGKRIGASHYNGATLWFVAAKTDTPRKLEWKGSHTGIAIHPDGDAVVTTMQENALHGWRLSDGQHMRMSGYPAKTDSLSFSRNGKWLASGGADSIVFWPFFGGGPMGKAPTERAPSNGIICTRVACHPQQEICAAGFADGVVVISDIASPRLILVMEAGRGRVSALAWSEDGTNMAVGTETGFAALIDFGGR